MSKYTKLIILLLLILINFKHIRLSTLYNYLQFIFYLFQTQILETLCKLYFQYDDSALPQYTNILFRRNKPFNQFLLTSFYLKEDEILIYYISIIRSVTEKLHILDIDWLLEYNSKLSDQNNLRSSL